MKVELSTINQILSSLKDYNPTVYALTDAVSKALIPVALVILATLMYMELANTNRMFAQEQGKMNINLFILVGLKYFIAFALVMMSGQIIGAIVWLNSAIGWLIDKTVTTNSSPETVIPEIKGKLNFLQKGLIYGMQMIAYFFIWASTIVAKILVFLRFFTLYIYKGVAPILLSAYVSDEWKNVATNFIRGFVALIFQGFLLVLILKIYPALISNDMFDLVASGTFVENVLVLFIVIAKSVIFIILLIGSQNMVKRWMGV